jgi:hypothetical protein
VDDSHQKEVIARLQQQLSDAQAKRAALLEDVIHLTARIHETRREFGNPFYYSHPDEPDEGITRYTGNASHKVGQSTFQELRRVERELLRLKEQLRRLGVS